MRNAQLLAYTPNHTSNDITCEANILPIEFSKVELYDDKARAGSAFDRNASPQQISDSLNGTGCYIKYDEEVDLPEEEKNEIGDLFIQTSYNVPGL